jgi:hypothetical protein
MNFFNKKSIYQFFIFEMEYWKNTIKFDGRVKYNNFDPIWVIKKLALYQI